MKKITCTEALVELKLLDKKIADAQNKTIVGHITNKANPLLPQGFKSLDEFLKDVQSKLDSAVGLIKYRDNLKSKLALSNAVTQVVIGGNTMTVAEAIEKKNSLKYKKELYTRLKNGFDNAKLQVDNHNNGLQGRADLHVNQAFANVQSADNVARNNERESFLRKNENVFLTSDKVETTINSLAKEIQEFEATVDIALSISNANTHIELD